MAPLPVVSLDDVISGIAQLPSDRPAVFLSVGATQYNYQIHGFPKAINPHAPPLGAVANAHGLALLLNEGLPWRFTSPDSRPPLALGNTSVFAILESYVSSTSDGQQLLTHLSKLKTVPSVSEGVPVQDVSSQDVAQPLYAPHILLVGTRVVNPDNDGRRFHVDRDMAEAFHPENKAIMMRATYPTISSLPVLEVVPSGVPLFNHLTDLSPPDLVPYGRTTFPVELSSHGFSIPRDLMDLLGWQKDPSCRDGSLRIMGAADRIIVVPENSFSDSTWSKEMPAIRLHAPPEQYEVPSLAGSSLRQVEMGGRVTIPETFRKIFSTGFGYTRNVSYERYGPVIEIFPHETLARAFLDIPPPGRLEWATPFSLLRLTSRDAFTFPKSFKESTPWGDMTGTFELIGLFDRLVLRPEDVQQGSYTNPKTPRA